MKAAKSSRSIDKDVNDIRAEALERLYKVISEVMKSVRLRAQALSAARELEYPDGTFASVSSLLYCPVKWRLQQQHPDEAPEMNISIQNGFFWEETAKSGFLDAFGHRVQIEPLIYSRVNGKLIAGHPDCVVKGDVMDLVVELKAPKFISVLPNHPIEKGLIISDSNTIAISKHYIWQSMIQQYIYRRYTGKECIGVVLAYSTTCINGSYTQGWFARLVDRAFSDREMRLLVEQFSNDIGPRYNWECRYCPWKRKGYCRGLPVRPLKIDTDVSAEELRSANELVLESISIHHELSKKIASANRELEQVKNTIRNAIPRGKCVVVGDKVTGWVKRRGRKWNMTELVKYLLENHPEQIERFLKVTNEAELTKLLGDDISLFADEEEYEHFVYMRPVDTMPDLVGMDLLNGANKADMQDTSQHTQPEQGISDEPDEGIMETESENKREDKKDRKDKAVHKINTVVI